MRIFGIDPGTAITGFGVIDGKDSPTLVTAGVIRTPAKQALELRLEAIYADLLELIREYRPDEIAIEQIFFATNAKTVISVSHARGVAMLAAIHAGVAIAEYTPLQIKQAITGYGRADKQQIQEMVRAMLKLETVPKPDDAADALAVAICHSQVLTA
ncbi:MAG: crossover junction endodeoxyribonuclease RuvC [Candidatus Saccharimonadales bacterium]